MNCPNCGRPTARHELAAARHCLAILAEAGRALLECACGNASQAALERELVRPSPAWRS